MSEGPHSVLIVGRDPDGALAALRGRGWETATARDVEGAFSAIDVRPFDAVVTELDAPRLDGMAVLRRALERDPEAWVVIVADAPSVERVVAGLKAGAADVMVRPVHPDRLAAVLDRGLAHRRLARRLEQVEERLDQRFDIGSLAGRSRGMARVRDQIRHVAASRATVLIEGEPGTGKGVLARVIHQRGPRRAEPFVWASCAALAPELAEAELFGEEGGGGNRVRGRIELADRGTLYLEQIDALAPPLQVRLLRFLLDRGVERGAGREALRVDARLIVSTSRDLAEEVRAGRFREDLYLKLSAVRIEIPPLRQRLDDLPLLAQALLAELQREHGRRVKGLTRGALERLARHDWPGNVRELLNVLESMVVFGADSRRGIRLLGVADLPPAWREADDAGEELRISVGMTAAEAERRLIEATMRHARQDKPRAAAMLGIGLRTLYRKLEAFGMRQEPAGSVRRTRARVRTKPRRRGSR